jgi:hypothetical protein
LISRNNAQALFAAPRELEDVTVTRQHAFPRTLRRAVGRRLVLGLLMTLLAIVAGWTLVPPQVGTDAATVYWYTH